MSIESEIFKKYKLKESNLVPYGFIKEKGLYKYSKEFMNNTFRANIYINGEGQVLGKVIEIELNEEYTNFRMENAIGEFVNTVRDEYIKILQDLICL